MSDDLARASIRFRLGRFTTDEEIDYTIEPMTSVVTRLREMSREVAAGRPPAGPEAAASYSV